MKIRGAIVKSVSGRFQFVPFYAYDGSLTLDEIWPNKYKKFEGDKLTRFQLNFEKLNPQYVGMQSYVVDLFGLVNKNFVAKGIVKVNDTKGFSIQINSIRSTSPVAVKSELAGLAFIRNAFELAAVSYGALIVNGNIPYTMNISVTAAQAQEFANILHKDGANVTVVDLASGNESVSNHSLKVEEVAPVAPPVEEVDQNYFYIEEHPRMVCNMLGQRYKGNSYQGTTTVLFDGPSGFGKTSVASRIAEVLGMNLFYMDMTLVLEVEELLGFREISEGSTQFKTNPFVAAISKGNCVVVLDELNRTSPSALNALLPLLDFRGKLIVHGQEVEVGPRVVFIATLNLGSKFTGTQKTDAALTNRFELVASFGDIPVAHEAKILTKRTGISQEQATLIAEIAKEIRATVPGVEHSPRNTIALAGMVKDGIPLRLAYQYNVLGSIRDIQIRRQVEDIVNRMTKIIFESAIRTFKVKYF